jgi:hypothetical protein
MATNAYQDVREKIMVSMKKALMYSASLLMIVGSTSQAQAQVKRYISVDSHCSKPLRFYVSHADGYRNWHVHGPYDFAAYEGPTRLKNNNVVLTQTENHDLYIYAESMDGRTVWEGNYNFDYNGLQFSMMKANLSIQGGELRVKLTCD